MREATNFKGYDGIFARRLFLIMQENHTKQTELAEYLGLTRQAISKYTDGSAFPSADNLKKICEYYNVSSDYLLGLSASQSTNADERLITDITGLNNTAVSKLKSFNNSNDEIDKNIILIINRIINSGKVIHDLSETFIAHYKSFWDLENVKKRQKEVEIETRKAKKPYMEHEEAVGLYENYHKLKKENAWLDFLIINYVKDIFNAYAHDVRYLNEQKGIDEYGKKIK